MLLGNSKPLFPLVKLLPWRKNKLFDKDTALVIDGFQRSGNSFFYSVVKHANSDLKISIHTHSSINAIKSIRSGVPVSITLRHPLDVIKSLLVWDERLSVSIALRCYIRY